MIIIPEVLLLFMKFCPEGFVETGFCCSYSGGAGFKTQPEIHQHSTVFLK